MNDSFFGYDGPFFSVLNRISDIIILNVLWIVCCIPIVTIGASTTAMLYVTMKIVNGEDAYIVRKFFKSFKENFLQSTVIWLIMLAVGAVLVCNFFWLLPNMKVNDTVYTLFFSATCLTTLIYVMILVWLFALQARLENKIKNTFSNALLLSFRHLPTTILLILLVFVPIALVTQTFATLFYVWFLVAGAGIGLICSLLYNRIFNIYIKPAGESEGISEDSFAEEVKEAFEEDITEEKNVEEEN